MAREIEKKEEDPSVKEIRQFIRKFLNGTVTLNRDAGYESDQSTISIMEGVKKKRGRPTGSSNASSLTSSSSTGRRVNQRLGPAPTLLTFSSPHASSSGSSSLTTPSTTTSSESLSTAQGGSNEVFFILRLCLRFMTNVLRLLINAPSHPFAATNLYCPLFIFFFKIY